jgi:quercetin dioxygenase-like cupin family protein
VADKVIKILESVSDNEGARTTIKTILAPDATVFPHYYTLFNETFETLEGEINVWNDDSKIILSVGQSAIIEKNTTSLSSWS